MTTLSPDVLSDLIDALRTVNAEYANTVDPIKRRQAWIDGVECLIRTTMKILPLPRGELLFPFIDLCTSLADLNFGTADPALQPQKVAHRPPNPRRVRFRAHAAAASEILIRNGVKATDADDWVAKRLSNEGYRKPPIRGDTRITGSTIKGWRKAAREQSRGELMRDTFESWMRIDVKSVFDQFRLLDPYLEHDKEERPAGATSGQMLEALLIIEFITKNFTPAQMAEK